MLSPGMPVFSESVKAIGNASCSNSDASLAYFFIRRRASFSSIHGLGLRFRRGLVGRGASEPEPEGELAGWESDIVRCTAGDGKGEEGRGRGEGRG